MLRTLTTDPWNAEAPLGALRDACTPIESFYVRNNFAPPALDDRTWRLRIGGAVEREVELDLGALRALEHVDRRVTLECAGNGRLLLDPPAPGTQWELGAAGTALFTGVRLRDVLAQTAVEPGAVECVFTGADSGPAPGHGVVPFQRSLPLDVARADGPLLAWAMNGAPLTRDHGFPVRLVVPGWYAVASVKWLIAIDVLDRPFDGHFQRERYVYRKEGRTVEPVTTMRVRSLITSPAAGETVRAGRVRVEGVAWSGAQPIVRVDVALDDGDWLPAVLDADARPAEPAGWSIDAELEAGRHRLRVRATDASGATQPESADWNELGYGNNAVHVVEVFAAG